MPDKQDIVAPAGMLLCKGKNSSCGKVAYEGSKGGPKPTDVLFCDGDAACDDDDCECKLCYTIKFKRHDELYVFLPYHQRPSRSEADDIEKEERSRAKTAGLVIEKFDWRCFCLKEKPITGKK